MSYWIFFAVLISCAMGIVPWFAYFDFNFSLYYDMLLPLFGPIIGALLFVIILHCDTYKYIECLLLFLTIIFFIAEVGLAFSFTLVWSLNAVHCSINDLDGLRTVILVGHATSLVLTFWLQLWCIRCYKALSFAKPEKYQSNVKYSYHAHTGAPPGAHGQFPFGPPSLSSHAPHPQQFGPDFINSSRSDPRTSQSSSKLLKHLNQKQKLPHQPY